MITLESKDTDINLTEELQQGLNDSEFTTFSELQKAVIPSILEGNDLVVKAENDFDKKASFIIAALQKISGSEERSSSTKTLILSPETDDIRAIDKFVWAAGDHAEIKCASIDHDGEPEDQQESLLSGAEVVVGNPDLVAAKLRETRHIFRDIDLVITDNVSNMLELGLMERIGDILKRVLSEHQTIIFSSEINPALEQLADDMLEDPMAIGLDDNYEKRMLRDSSKINENLTHSYIYVPNRMKISTLMAHLNEHSIENGVIFTASKRGTDRLYQIFKKEHLKATSLHGKLSDDKRTQRFAKFTNGEVQFLLVADIPAQELQLEGVTHVINYDVPKEIDRYRHRASIMNTSNGSLLLSLVSKQDRSDINRLEKELNKAPIEHDLPQAVKDKMKERKQKKNKSKKKKQRQKQKKRQKKKNNSKKEKKNKMGLPQPSYDKLDGGRNGDSNNEKSSVIGLIKQLFS